MAQIRAYYFEHYVLVKLVEGVGKEIILIYFCCRVSCKIYIMKEMDTCIRDWFMLCRMTKLIHPTCLTMLMTGCCLMRPMRATEAAASRELIRTLKTTTTTMTKSALLTVLNQAPLVHRLCQVHISYIILLTEINIDQQITIKWQKIEKYIFKSHKTEWYTSVKMEELWILVISLLKKKVLVSVSSVRVAVVSIVTEPILMIFVCAVNKFLPWFVLNYLSMHTSSVGLL